MLLHKSVFHSKRLRQVVFIFCFLNDGDGDDDDDADAIDDHDDYDDLHRRRSDFSHVNDKKQTFPQRVYLPVFNEPL